MSKQRCSVGQLLDCLNQSERQTDTHRERTNRTYHFLLLHHVLEAVNIARLSAVIPQHEARSERGKVATLIKQVNVLTCQNKQSANILCRCDPHHNSRYADKTGDTQRRWLTQRWRVATAMQILIIPTTKPEYQAPPTTASSRIKTTEQSLHQRGR